MFEKEGMRIMNFDQRINRRGTGCVKWEGMDKQYGGLDMIPMWVADMDFEVAKPISEALRNRVNHGVYGYVDDDDRYRSLFANHFNTYQNHNVESSEVILSTGVVYSINACIQKLTSKQDKIMICSPAYPPFRRVVVENHRTLVDVPLCINNNRYEMDFEAMERVVEGCRMFILCNPHNPTGRIFDKDELEKLANFCEKHQMLIVSDEIHADFLFEKKFIPIVSVSEYAKQHTITCVSCTKSFNLAALNVSAIFIQNPSLYETMNSYLSLNGLQSINVFGLTAMKAAYEKSQDWLNALVAYLKENRDDAYAYIKKHLPKVVVYKQEATYLMWLDMRNYGNDIHERLCHDARVLMNDGKTFGDAYEGYLRLNIACPKEQLMEALERIEKVLNQQ